LTPDGFKNHETLKVGDDIYTWKDGKLNIQEVQRVNVKHYKGIMHQYRGRDACQTVTPNHRILYKKNNSTEVGIKESHELFNLKTPLAIPVALDNSDREDYDISDDMIKMLAIVLTDGHLKKSKGIPKSISIYKSSRRGEGIELIESTLNSLGYVSRRALAIKKNSFHVEKYKEKEYTCYEYTINTNESKEILKLLNYDRSRIPKFMFKFSQRQALLFITTWAKFDGHIEKIEGRKDRIKIQCDNHDIADSIQHLCFLAGRGSRIKERLIYRAKNPTIYVYVYARKYKDFKDKTEINHDDLVWCPTTEDGIVVYRKDGVIFISHNSPFSNLSIFDRPKLSALLEDKNYGWYFPRGDLKKEDWHEYVIEYIIELQNIYMKFFDKGDPLKGGSPYRFPIATVNLSKISTDNGFIIEDQKFLKSICKSDIYRYNIFTSEGTKVASCCRLLSDIEMLDYAAQSNSFGAGGSISLGSLRVLTVNFARMALQANTMEDFYELLESRVEDTAKILKAHKQLIMLMTEKGLQPFIANGWINKKRLFSTFGILGMVECESILKKKFKNRKNIDLTEEVLTKFNELVSTYSEKHGIIGNIEQIPAESMCHRLASSDQLLFGKEATKYPLYANQFIPLWDTESSIYERMEKDGKYNQLLTGGGIVHINTGEHVTSKQAEHLIVKSINSGCEHFAITGTFCQCEDNHRILGNSDTCKKCGSPVITKMARTVGFWTPVEDWSKLKIEYDHEKRKEYSNGDFKE
jgi:anaerobic ribonucleoside-triphosphate reductase